MYIYIYIYIYYFLFSFFFDSMFISVEDCTRRIQFSYNYSMSFTYSQIVMTKQAGDTLSPDLTLLKIKKCMITDQNMYI